MFVKTLAPQDFVFLFVTYNLCYFEGFLNYVFAMKSIVLIVLLALTPLLIAAFQDGKYGPVVKKGRYRYPPDSDCFNEIGNIELATGKSKFYICYSACLENSLSGE